MLKICHDYKFIIKRIAISTIIFIILLFSPSVIIINPMQWANAQMPRTNILKPQHSSPASENASAMTFITTNLTNTKSGAPKFLGEAQPQATLKPSTSLDISRIIVNPEPGQPNATQFAALKARADTLNATTATNKTVFSLNITNQSSSSPPRPSSSISLANPSSTSSITPPTPVSNSVASQFSPSNPPSLQVSGSTSFNITLGNGTILSIPTSNSPSLITTKISQGFEALDDLKTGQVTPPDAQLAVGPNHVGEMVNDGGQFWKKDHAPATPIFALQDFFSSGGNDITDPRLVFDSDSGRWFAVIQDITNDSIHVAVSNTPDPTGKWKIFEFPFSHCPDQPTIGISKDKFVISANVFTNHCSHLTGMFSGVQLTVVKKSDLVNGVIPALSVQSPEIKGHFSMHPALALESNETSTVYLVQLGDVGNSGGRTVTLFNLTGQVPRVALNGAIIGPIQPVGVPPTGLQPGSDVNGQNGVDTDGARVTDASYHNSILWLGANDDCVPANDTKDRSCIRLIQINTTSNKVMQDFDTGINGTYLYYPALGIDWHGNLDIIYGYSSLSLNPGLFVSGQLVGGHPNQLDLAVPLQSGSGPITAGGRAGDYQALAIDPKNPSTFWVVGELNSRASSNPYWSTFIGNFTTSNLQTIK
jgi:hypothetical protein